MSTYKRILMAHQTAGMMASVTSLSPAPEAHHDRPDEHEDLTPSDSQPPGVDTEPQSLEEALTG